MKRSCSRSWSFWSPWACSVCSPCPWWRCSSRGLALQAALSAVFACLFNVGPGFGDIGPLSSYTLLHDYTKGVLAVLMIMGRLELYAILVLFSPALWRKAV